MILTQHRRCQPFLPHPFGHEHEDLCYQSSFIIWVWFLEFRGTHYYTIGVSIQNDSWTWTITWVLMGIIEAKGPLRCRVASEAGDLKAKIWVAERIPTSGDIFAEFSKGSGSNILQLYIYIHTLYIQFFVYFCRFLEQQTTTSWLLDDDSPPQGDS